MVELAGGHPVYSVDYFTSAVTPRYLAALRREFQISAEAGANSAERSPYAAERERLLHPDQLLHPLGQELCNRAAVRGLPEFVQDEVGSLVDGLLLLPGLQGDVHHQMPRLRQAVQTPVVLRGRSVAARASCPERTPSGREGSGGIPEGLCMDSGAAHTEEECGHGGRPLEFSRGRTGPTHAAQPCQP
ncbi:hypothetical protein TIFTF001_018830 [Ficus carica]|uniref:Uncharacterized protein n=1 Tax=Ficus carica TaxID=3494 RepID=A0AA88D9M2_FICCA|nr:hypothetical protein TIFTF001_018830 [Ficus carica]